MKEWARPKPLVFSSSFSHEVVCCALSPNTHTQIHTLPVTPTTRTCKEHASWPKAPHKSLSSLSMSPCLFLDVSFLSFGVFLWVSGFLSHSIFFCRWASFSFSVDVSVSFFGLSVFLSFPLYFPLPITCLSSQFPCESLTSHRHRCACRCFTRRDAADKQ